MAELFTLPKQVPLNSSGNLLSGATLTFEQAGTSTLQNTYSDIDLTTPHTNPVVADGFGVFPAIFLDDSLRYKVTLKDSAGVLLYAVDDFIDQASSWGWSQANAESDATITPSDITYPVGYIERYGGVADGTTDSTTALETAISVGRQAVRFWETGRTNTLNTYTDANRFYIIRDAYIDRGSIIGPANFTSDGTQTDSVLRLGRDADNTNGHQWRYHTIHDITFSGKQRTDNCITFGNDNDEPNNLTSGWKLTNCFFERPNIGIWKQFGNLGNSYYDCSASNGNYGYYADAYPKRILLGANEATGQTVLTVDNSTDANANDIVRIQLNDDTEQQTTIVSVDSATQITVNDALTGDADSGNYIKIYHPDFSIPVSLQHTGADRFYGGEWSGMRKAAFYIDGQNTAGNGQHIFDGVIVENNPGFGFFIKEYNNAFNPLILRNVWFESNATSATVDLDDGEGDRTPRDLYLEEVDHCIVEGSQLADIEIIDSYVEFDRCKMDSTNTSFTITGESHTVFTNAQIVQWGDDDTGAKDVVIESITGPLREASSVMRQWIAPPRDKLVRVPPNSGTYVGGDTFENGEDLIDITASTDLTATIVDGFSFPTASRYTLSVASNQYQTGATPSAASVSANKFVVVTQEMRLVSGALSDVSYIGSATWTRTTADALLNDHVGEWRTLAWVGKTGANTGTCRMRIGVGAGGSAVVDFGPNQVIEFDTEGEAIDYYNQRYLCVNLAQKPPQWPTTSLPSANALQPGLIVFDTTDSRVKVDDGTAFQTIGGDTKVKTADKSLNTNTTLEDDNHLAGWSVDTDGYYKISGYLRETHNVGDIKIMFDFTNTPQVFSLSAIGVEPVAATLVGSQEESDSTSISITTLTDSVENSIELSGYFQANASTGGTVDFQWAQDTSSANNTIVREGSWITIEKVG